MPLIPFELTAAQVIALDAAPYIFASLGANSGAVRVPRSFVVYKPAGDAFTVGIGARLEVKDDDNNLLFSIAAEGLLDQVGAQSRYVESATSGKSFSSGSTTFSISCSGALSGGGPNVYFRFTFEEVQVVW